MISKYFLLSKPLAIYQNALIGVYHNLILWR